ncbi:MAG: hypothetical protein AAF447_04030 [Myxococcota bacterium]
MRRVVAEAPLRRVRLGPPLDAPNVEISGLDWLRSRRGPEHDRLVFLPQYPERVGGVLFTATRSEVAAAVWDRATLHPRTLPIALKDTRSGCLVLPLETLASGSPGYEGFEAIAFIGDRAFLTTERSLEDGSSDGIVFPAVLDSGFGLLLITRESRRLRRQVRYGNLAYEALVATGEPPALALHEVNGAPNERPVAFAIWESERAEGRLDVEPRPAPPLEYRVTDATSADRTGRFWVTNYFWPGEAWTPGPDALIAVHGQGPSHGRSSAVERLVELRFDGEQVTLTGRAPISLALGPVPRNWEGVVRFGRGFLVVTDRHPETILAYVEAP